MAVPQPSLTKQSMPTIHQNCYNQLQSNLFCLPGLVILILLNSYH